MEDLSPSEDLEAELKTLPRYHTHGFPGEILEKIEEENIYELDEYRSLVDKLLYCVMKIDPDCTNAVRELSQHMQSPGRSHWRELRRVIAYLYAKKWHELVLRKPIDL